MSVPSPHTDKSFDGELEHLRGALALMGELVETELRCAIEALAAADPERAARVLESDAEVDDLEAEIERTALRLLALRQPLAVDLREIVSSLKIASDLERIGDYAANVAKRAMALAPFPAEPPSQALADMARLVRASVRDAVGAYLDRDDERALDVWRRDQEVDRRCTLLFRELLADMTREPRRITWATHQLFIAKNIERMGDHATNIAETAHYVVTGERIAGRPKADRSSFEVVAPPAADHGAGGGQS